MIGHGAVVTLFGLLAGFGLVMSITGGFEVFPGEIVEFDMPSDNEAWARAHAGGLLNGILVIVGALVLTVMGLSEKISRRLFWMLVGTGYANTIFYWGGLWADNRAVTFGDNREGETSVVAVLAFLPAFIFAFVTTVAIATIAWQAFRVRPE